MTCGQSIAMTWEFGDFDIYKGSCSIIGWGGQQPSSGKLSLPKYYTDDNEQEYVVDAIAPHALDHLTTVTQIEIHENIAVIGDAKAVSGSVRGVKNFVDCPKLTKFIVNSANQKFAATAAGVLVSKNAKILYKVPQAMDLSTGSFGMSSSVEVIADSAFSENTTIKTMTLSRMLWTVSADAGFSEMKAISHYSMSANEKYKTSNGALYSATSNVLIAYPVAKEDVSFTLPSWAKGIGGRAFANVEYLESVSLPSSVSFVGDRAFNGALALKAVEFPSGVTSIGEEALKDCPNLAEITFGGSIEIPKGFAQGCRSLSAVKCKNGVPAKVGAFAFQNCEKLTVFPFSAMTQFNGDYAFAGCGFYDVVYNDDPIGGDSNTGHYLFKGCKNLRSIDMSAVSADGEYKWLAVPWGYAEDCPELVKVTLAGAVNFSRGGSGMSPVFGSNSNLTKIVTGSFMGVPGAKFIVYIGSGVRTPSVYTAIRADKSITPRLSYSQLFGTMGGAKVEPTIYCDLYKPCDSDQEQGLYVCPGAEYYLPGGVLENYAKAAEAGCRLKEMYEVKAYRVDDKIRVECRSNYPYVTIDAITLNGAVTGLLSPSGMVEFDMPYDNLETFCVDYTVTDVKMRTEYPKNVVDVTGVMDLTAGDNIVGPSEYYNLQGIRVATPSHGGVYIVRRDGKVTKEMFR